MSSPLAPQVAAFEVEQPVAPIVPRPLSGPKKALVVAVTGAVATAVCFGTQRMVMMQIQGSEPQVAEFAQWGDDWCSATDCRSCAGKAGCVWTLKRGCLSNEKAEEEKLPIYSDSMSCDCVQHTTCDACIGGSVWCSWCPGVYGYNQCITSDGKNANRCTGYVDNFGTCPAAGHINTRRDWNDFAAAMAEGTEQRAKAALEQAKQFETQTDELAPKLVEEDVEAMELAAAEVKAVEALAFSQAKGECQASDCKSCAGQAGCVWTTEYGCMTNEAAAQAKKPVFTDPLSCSCIQHDDCGSCLGGSVWCAWCPGVGGYNTCITDDDENKNRCTGYVPNSGTCPARSTSSTQPIARRRAR
eukprot:CAMPEP_0204373828 /NCGR_PEP_ID=MMETSP0469-20131031/48306_1 /ASSEMBLY_ACC=CAM_ASM_000384 /TAXON_ID=2969 /ORGANISM="Oxyrrhis marina" /LENGTH=356 /DNA_ID=CAMNT_0051364355 /DNA_START=32 /DNA_END=1102 /DNA_ORIENTATION=+